MNPGRSWPSIPSILSKKPGVSAEMTESSSCLVKFPCPVFITAPTPGLAVMTKLSGEIRLGGCPAFALCPSYVCVYEETLFCALQMGVSELVICAFDLETSPVSRADCSLDFGVSD